MRNALFTLALIATLSLFAAAQDNKVPPPLTARENASATSADPDSQPVETMGSSNLPFCPPKTCLYYAGDFDSTDFNANALFNANSVGTGVEAWTFVGVKPPKAVTVTGVTFNQFFTSPFTGTNPTPFQTQINIVPYSNNGGTIVCNTSGNATMKQYGESDFGLVQYSYTVKKLAKPCRIQPGSKGATYVNLLPTSSSGYGYVVDVEDAKPKNHRGWNNDTDDCYFYATQGTGYDPCTTQGMGFDEFSIALTGK